MLPFVLKLLRRALFLSFVAGGLAAGFAGDWPRWGGGPSCNAVSAETGLPVHFAPGEKDPQGGGIMMNTTTNVRWAARLGSYAYGNPVVSQGRILVGTDVKTLSTDSRFKGYTKGGLVKCLDEATGKLLWQLVTPERKNLPENMYYRQQHLGTCSSATVDGDRVYVLTCAAEILCLDLEGQKNGNQGPYLDEGQYMAGLGKTPVPVKSTDADIIWRYDVIQELGVYIHDTASCSILIHGDFLYVTTGNGVDKSHELVLAPKAPAFIVLDKRTGKLLAREDEGICTRLFHAQWSSPSLGVVNGRPLVFLGGADGICYAFEALTQAPAEVAKLKKVWSYDCNPPEFRTKNGVPIRYIRGDKRKKESTNKNDGAYVGPSEIIATAVFHDNRVYVGIGQDPMHGRGRGMFHCIDATKSGDLTGSGCLWKFSGIDRTIASASIADGLVYITDISGKLFCLDDATGKCLWTFDTETETWGGALVADGKLYFGNKKGLYILKAGRELALLDKILLGAPAYSTPIVANGVLYVTSQNYLWAVKNNP